MGILKAQDARSIKSQSEALPLLRRLLVRFRLLVLLLLLFRLHRCRLRVLRRRGPRLRRWSVLGLRTLVRWRSRGRRNWLRPVGLRPVVRLGCGGAICFGPTRFCSVWLWLVVRLGRSRTVRLRPIVRLGSRGTIGLRTVRFRPSARRRLFGASAAVLLMRCWGIGRWLNGGTVVGCPCLFCWHNGAVVKRARLRSSGDWWRAVVYRSS
jgi:hypothetical protein